MTEHFKRSPKDIIVLWNGILITGFASGSFVKAQYSQGLFTKMVGALGDTIFLDNADRSGTAEISLLETSRSNDLLSGWVQTRNRGALQFATLVIEDAGGRSLVRCKNSVIMTMPPVSYGNTSEQRRWAIACGEIDIVVGGNEPQ